MSSKRHLSVNDDFFENIDSEKKAYWLGFLLADGCVSDRTVTLKLWVKDADHVQKFSKDLDSEYKISNIISKNRFGNFEQVRTGICSRKMVHDLGLLGVVRRKSLIAIPPVVDADLERHMMRGIFDGDGSIYTDKQRGNTQVSLCGSSGTCNRFSEWVHSVTGFVEKVRAHKDIFNVRVAKRDSVIHVLRELYRDSCVGLDRKMLLASAAVGGF